VTEFAEGQIFIHEGAAAENFHVLIQGSVKLYKLLPDGRRQIVSFKYRGSLLGLAASSSYTFSAEALSPVRICRISREKLRNILHECPQIEGQLFHLAVEELIRAQEQILLLGRKTAFERIASFLILHASSPQPPRVRPPRIHLPMSRTDIADYLGMTNETVSRVLAKLKKRGAIAIPNVHEIVILSDALLMECAKFYAHPLERPQTEAVRTGPAQEHFMKA